MKNEKTSKAVREFIRYAEAGDLKRVSAMLDAEPKLATTRSSTGDTALHAAALQGQIDICKQLLDRGGNLKAKGNYGNSPLHWAVASGSLKLVKLLLKRGADPTVSNNEGQTPLLIAINTLTRGLREAPAIVTLLKSSSSDIRSEIEEAITKGNPTKLSQILDANPAFMSRSNNSSGLLEKALAYAYEPKNVKVLKLLLEHGADAKGKSSANQPLITLSTNPQAAALMLEHGADIDATNFLGLTLADYARQTGNKELQKVIREYRSRATSTDSTSPKRPLRIKGLTKQ